MRIFFRLFFLFVTVFILLEIGLRLIGYQAFTLPDYSFVSDPVHCFEPKSNLGISLIPGNFEVTINKELHYRVKHTKDSLRSTEPTSHDSKYLVQFHGCSFTYGTGVDDEETYPSLLNQKFPTVSIQNHAVPGYAQLQLLNQLKSNPEKFAGTNLIVLNYLSFHDERNTLNANYQEKLNIGYQITKRQYPSFSGDFTFPYAELENNQLILKQKHIQKIHKKSFWRNNSALVNWAVKLYQNSKVSENEDVRVTKAIFKNIHTLCSENSIDLLITFMNKDQRSIELMDYCEKLGAKALDISIDWGNPLFTNQPFDKHPSAEAHQYFADKISKKFTEFLPISLSSTDKDITTFETLNLAK